MPQKKKQRAAAPVPTEHDERARERDRREEDAVQGPSTPDGISGYWQ